jgi:hypothetical protein
MARNVHQPEEWDDFDEVTDSPPATPPGGPHPMPAIPCGLYQVDEPGGSTVPIRVRRRADHSNWAPGKWVMEWLIGHDGRTWETFAFVTNTSLEIYKRFKGTDYDTVGTMLFKHFYDGECFDGWEFRLEIPRCAKCGKKINDADRERGLGPGCAKRWGL